MNKYKLDLEAIRELRRRAKVASNTPSPDEIQALCDELERFRELSVAWSTAAISMRFCDPTIDVSTPALYKIAESSARVSKLNEIEHLRRALAEIAEYSGSSYANAISRVNEIRIIARKALES